MTFQMFLCFSLHYWWQNYEFYRKLIRNAKIGKKLKNFFILSSVQRNKEENRGIAEEKIGQRNRNIYEKRVFRVEFFSSEFLWIPLTSRYKTHRKCFDEENYMYKYIKWEEYARKIFLFLFILSSSFSFFSPLLIFSPRFCFTSNFIPRI